MGRKRRAACSSSGGANPEPAFRHCLLLFASERRGERELNSRPEEEARVKKDATAGRGKTFSYFRSRRVCAVVVSEKDHLIGLKSQNFWAVAKLTYFPQR